MHALKFKTRLVARHFIPDPKGAFVSMGSGAMRKLGLIERLMSSEQRYREVKEDKRVEDNRVVTDAFVNFVVDQLQTETSAFGDFKFHDSGTGVGAEAAADTVLGTPCGEARDTGTQTEGASANIYKSVATHTYAGSFAITEHGLFNIAAAGILMDRTKFAAINVVATEKIEFTFEITFSSGG